MYMCVISTGPTRNLYQRLNRANGDLTRCSVSSTTLVNRTHVADLATVLYASMTCADQGRNQDSVINVADDLPATQYDVSDLCYI